MKLSDDPEKRARSLENLEKGKFNTESARAAQLKGVETKKRQREMLELVKLASKDVEDIGALTLMRGMVAQYLDNQDYEGAQRLLAQIAEYEAPKLQRQEVNQVVSTRELSDEELAEELKKLEL